MLPVQALSLLEHWLQGGPLPKSVRVNVPLVSLITAFPLRPGTASFLAHLIVFARARYLDLVYRTSQTSELDDEAALATAVRDMTASTDPRRSGSCYGLSRVRSRPIYSSIKNDAGRRRLEAQSVVDDGGKTGECGKRFTSCVAHRTRLSSRAPDTPSPGTARTASLAALQAFGARTACASATTSCLQAKAATTSSRPSSATGSRRPRCAYPRLSVDSSSHALSHPLSSDCCVRLCVLLGGLLHGARARVLCQHPVRHPSSRTSACAMAGLLTLCPPSFLIDELHAHGHTACSPACFISTAMQADPSLRKINSSAAECAHSGFGHIAHSLSFMNEEHAALVLWAVIQIHNRKKLIQTGQRALRTE